MKFKPGFLLLFYFLILIRPASAQPSFGEEEKFKWTDTRPVELPANIEQYSGSDLVILDEKTELFFNVNDATFDIAYLQQKSLKEQYGISNAIDGRNTGKLIRHLLIKINSAKGLVIFKNYSFPESFDKGYDAGLYKQGRRARITIPYIDEFKIKQLAVRKYDTRWLDVKFKEKYRQVRWIRRGGEFADEDMVSYELQDLEAGDVVELYYEAGFKSDYGANLFYFNGAYPKVKCEYDFTYKINKNVSGYAYVLPLHIKDSLIKKSASVSANYYTQTQKIALTNLKGINYPANSSEGQTLPHVYADFNFKPFVQESFPDDAQRFNTYAWVRPRKFEWLIFYDTSSYVKVYNKHFSAVRKFTATLPKPGNDSLNVIFFKALCDTLNSYRHLTTNHLLYNESNLYNVSSGDHLLKRRVLGDSSFTLYTDILNENAIPYYRANIEDKRYGEHSIYYRAHLAYEQDLVAIPSKNSYIYFMPRYNGLKYHLNELPFYYEGALAALKPENVQGVGKAKESSTYKFIKTHHGTYNENTRTENATVKISLDSLKASVLTKESLSGQFSTILRHLYLNEFIDSTISPLYFKKCTTKPGASDAKIKLSSKITDYPFRYTFNCTEKIALQSKTALHLDNWFSFLLSKEMIPEEPGHDYYFDFEFSDSYNFLLEFSNPVDIKNADAFSKKINNALFELESAIVKNSESSYLLKVKVAVKQTQVPEDKIPLLMELVSALDQLNGFALGIIQK